MSVSDNSGPQFDVMTEEPPGDILLCGFTEFGLAGLTAVDYLVEHLSLEAIGHVTADGLPAITPFADGRPRHHTRLYADDDIAVLVGELFVPPQVARPFADAVVDWAESDVAEIVVFSGVPVAHGPDDHRTFYIATEDYHDHRLQALDVPAMGGGYLTGVNAALVEQGIDSSLRVGVFTTPTHARTPDLDAALRLIETVEQVYSLGVDTEPLASFASDVQRHYSELAEHIQTAEEQQLDDRMYM